MSNLQNKIEEKNIKFDKKHNKNKIFKELDILLKEKYLPGGKNTSFRKNKEKCQQLFEKYYPDYKNYNYWFTLLILKYLRPDMLVLDAGCGRKMNFARKFQYMYGKFVGIDLEIDGELNSDSYLPIRGNLEHLPFRDSSFDMIICRWVIEHLPKPGNVFSEFNRVLKKDGYLIILTLNKYDYGSLVAKLTPNKLHRYFVKKVIGPKYEEIDVFVLPVFYRANTITSLKRILGDMGFKNLEIAFFSRYPSYLIFSATLFRLGILYEKIISKYKWLFFLKRWILGASQKVHDI